MNISRQQELQTELDRRQSLEGELTKRGLGNQASNNDNMGMNILHGLGNSILGAGDTIGGNIGKALSILPGVNISPIKREGASGSMAYQGGQIGGEIGSFVGGGALLDSLRAAAAAKNIPAVSKMAKSLGGNGASGVARRILGTGVGGFLTNPEDREKGAELGTALGVAGEALPYGLGKGVKLLQKGAENLYPQKLANQLGERIHSATKEWEKKAGEYYNPVINTFKNYGIYRANPSKEFLNLGPEIKQYFSPEVKRLLKVFENGTESISKHSFKIAHELQSLLGEEAYAVKGESRYAYQAMLHARDALKDDISAFLGKRNPKKLQDYLHGSQIFHEKVGPMRTDKYIREISEGKVKRISPHKLNEKLQLMKDRDQINPSHELHDISEVLSQKLNKADALSNISSLGIGGALGHWSGIPGGGMGGALLANMYKKPLLELSTNPEISKAFEKFKPYYHGIKTGIISNVLPGR